MLAKTRTILPPPWLLCGSNLSKIGRAALIYVNDHDAKAPLDFDSLIRSGLIDPNTLVCPCTGHKPKPGLPAVEWADYIMVSGIGAHHGVLDANAVITFCPPERHPDNIGWILFADAHVQGLKNDEFYNLLSDQEIEYVPDGP
jgi:hypothetical protein